MPTIEKKISKKSKDASTNTLLALGEKYMNGEMGIGEFSAYFLTELKHEYIRQFMYAFGDVKEMTAKEYGVLGNALRKQYKYADGLLDELRTGKLLSIKELLRRLKLYMESTDAMFEKALEQRKIKDGFKLERWVTDRKAENCADCITYARRGWVPIGTLPTPCDGHTACMNNCKCHKIYAKGK